MMLFGRENLGRDFWLFRFGQVISVIGDACGSIALAWWVLESTGSAAMMSSVIAPAEFVRIFLLPLFGPLGDRYSRKRLIIFSDLWRGVCTFILAGMAWSGFFSLTGVIGLYVISAVGTALFRASAGSIVPQLVNPEQLQTAMQQTQAIQSVGGILGGIIGGLIVSAFGVKGAFLIDGVSYLLAALASSLIVADTRPAVQPRAREVSAVQAWATELAAGFRMLYQIPLLFWFALVAMLMNFVVAPLAVVLPVLVKQGRGLPPWFLGALESSASIGGIVGAVAVGWLCKRLFADRVITGGIFFIGMGVCLLSVVPNLALPLVVMFWIGAGSALANIPLGSQIMLATPDHYRSRLGSITGFLCGCAVPLGMLFNGVLISEFGLDHTLVGMGIALTLLTPLLYLVPRFVHFMRHPPGEVGAYFATYYPGSFR